MKEKAFKYGLFLCVLGIVVGVLLSVVNAITAPIIATAEQEKVEAMLKEYNSVLKWETLEVADNDDYKNIQAIYQGTKEGSTDSVFVCQAKGLGYGNGEIITMVYIEQGIIKKVTNVSASGQTQGVGSVVYTEEALKVYEGKQVSAYANAKALDHKKGDVDVTSGATYTSRGVIEGVILACKYYANEVSK